MEKRIAKTITREFCVLHACVWVPVCGVRITYFEFDCSHTVSILGHCEDVGAFSCIGLRPQIDSAVAVRSLAVDEC